MCPRSKSIDAYATYGGTVFLSITEDWRDNVKTEYGIVNSRGSLSQFKRDIPLESVTNGKKED